ncbi:MAG: SPFH domain-containing protein [Flammeovirgaceae bacterium]|nr:SPFH domain-containing protein [Flammeovirgaceae bacterium]
MKAEIEVKLLSGYVMVLVEIILLVSFFAGIIQTDNPIFVILIGIFIICLKGFFFINPNGSRVLVLFGAYRGTVKENGFYWANPFLARQPISLRARNFDSKPVKVNDKLGNPIMIGVILVWQVKDTFKAAFEVDDYANFVNIQSDAAVRNLAGSYPYDNMDDENKEITLRSGLNEVNHALEEQLRERLEIAGINVIEARISYLAYASEIAGAMLRRQQATAIVAARQKIVEGAVGMVEMALHELSKKDIIDLDEEKKAAMVSNLMVVLTSDKDASPVINTGTLHQ